VRELTGLVLDPYFSGTKMDWLVQASALEGFSEPAFATIDTWLLWHLTGGPAGGVFATEASNASRTMLLELSTRSWSRELGELLRVDPALLAEVRPSVGSFGTINAPAVPELAGVPITAILGDQQAALFGQACFHPGMVKATYGTGSFVLAHAGSQVPAPTDGLVSTIAWDLGDFGAAAYAYEGSAFVAGAAIQWMRDELGLLASSAELDALADTVSDSGGLSFVPAFTGLGSPFWRPEARGVLLGLSRGSTKAHLARAMLEALAFQVRAITDTFAAAGLELRELRADGGVTASKRLLELQATASRLPVRRAASVEATARGAATAAALGVGLVSSLEQLEEFWTAERTVEPSEPFFLDLAYEAWRRAASRA
jgi:glycerol kinase